MKIVLQAMSEYASALRGDWGDFDGRFGVTSSLVLPAHRIALVWAIGQPIPFGLDVDHLCRNVSCVRPSHLEAVDRATNIARSTNKAAFALRGQCHRGHDLTAPNAWYEEPSGKRGCRLCQRASVLAHAKTPKARAKRNEHRRWLRANDPAYAERERERDRQRYREGRP